MEIPIGKWLNACFDERATDAKSSLLFASLCRDIGRKFSGDVAINFATVMQRKLFSKEWSEDELERLLASVGDSQLATFLRIELEFYKGRRENPGAAGNKKLAALLQFEDASGSVDAELFGEIAALYARAGDYRLALYYLRRAFELFPDFSFWTRRQAIANTIYEHAPRDVYQRELNVALAGSCTTSFLRPFLLTAGLAREMKLNIYEADFGAYAQEILDPESGLYRCNPDAILLLLESHDFNCGLRAPQNRVDDYVNKIKNLREIARSRSSACLIHTGLEIPPFGAWGGLEYTESDGRVRRIEEINLRLSEDLPSGVAFLHPSQLAELHDGEWTRSRDWYVAKQYPAPQATPVLATAYAANIAAFFGLSKRVLVMDLDNTAWGGVVGEDGPFGLRIGPSFSDGESFTAFQQYAKGLQLKGVLLAVCSKNNESDALQAFSQRSDMILKREDFVAFRANWQDKAANLRSIAQELSLGLDAFVFVDDNPAERTLIRKELPEVVTPEFDNQHWKIVPTLRRGMWFETVAITKEDRERHESYRSRAIIREMSTTATNLKDFLASLDMTATVEDVSEENVARVAQLINKTNQFNLTTRRFSIDEARRRAADVSWRCRAFTLRDAQTQHGLVGVLFAYKDSPEQWTIDLFVMSCRVIGRELENVMLADVQHAAREQGVKRLKGLFFPTQKNSQVKDFYRNRNFVATDVEGEWIFDVANQEPTCCDVISVVG
ncbi:MAG: HAD-IIIC family phosphatase [Thermoguttaceae bacterium]|nr:HAD-IIIC family phosphatase [Thermoguttaceae bacterium]